MTLLTEPTRIVLAKGQPVPVDLQGFGSVSLLLHGNGTNGSTTITDSSLTPKTVTAVGNAQISTDQSKFGGSSIYFDGVNSRATLAGSSTYSMPSDFTVEMWSYQISASGLITQFEFGNTNNAELGIMFRPGSNQLTIGSAGGSILNTSMNVTNNTWIHWAVARVGSAISVYKNGTAIASATSSATLTANSGIFLGDCLHATGRFWNGYIDDLRITKGIARYTANFTPPTAPFPDF